MADYAEFCPHCAADQRDGPISQEQLERGLYGPWDGIAKRYYYSTIGVELSRYYDGILYWMCAYCGGTWQRWPEGTYQHRIAAQFMRGSR
jgi:hypothetical protein